MYIYLLTNVRLLTEIYAAVRDMKRTVPFSCEVRADRLFHRRYALTACSRQRTDSECGRPSLFRSLSSDRESCRCSLCSRFYTRHRCE